MTRKLYFFGALVAAYFVCNSFAVDRRRLKEFPPTQPKFEVERSMENNHVIAKETWRSKTGECTTVATRLTQRVAKKGIFIIQDSFGNVLSGDQYVVADYKCFMINYGCVKRSVDGNQCEDMWIAVSTRKKYPEPYTFKLIDAILNKLFGFGIEALDRIKHERPCE